MRPAFSFGGGRLGQHRPGELPRLSHREARPPGPFAALALTQADEDPHGRMTRVAEREPADREFPPAARAQVPAKYRRVAEMLRDQITGATLPAGAPAPSGAGPGAGADARAFRMSLARACAWGGSYHGSFGIMALISAFLLLSGTG
jgi:hypothetical protein